MPGTVHNYRYTLRVSFFREEASQMPLKRVTVGKMLLEGDTDKELFGKYLSRTVSSMADLDGCLDDAQADI
jgi:hypothetical protein